MRKAGYGYSQGDKSHSAFTDDGLHVGFMAGCLGIGVPAYWWLAVYAMRQKDQTEFIQIVELSNKGAEDESKSQ